MQHCKTRHSLQQDIMKSKKTNQLIARLHVTLHIPPEAIDLGLSNDKQLWPRRLHKRHFRAVLKTCGNEIILLWDQHELS